jgi:cyanophycin synthetase
MFAAAIAFSMGQTLDDIRQGLQTFDTTFFQAPGRMNIFEEHPFKVILDYGHNPPAVRAMAELVRDMEVEGRRLVVMAAPGDRRDEDIRLIAAHCAGVFDHYICRRDDNPRGRAPDEVPRMLREALLAAGVEDDAIEAIESEEEAVATALGRAAHGDLLLVFGDDVRRCWDQITGFSVGGRPSPAATGAAATRPGTAVPAFSLSEEIPRAALSTAGDVIRDERGVRLAREQED